MSSQSIVSLIMGVCGSGKTHIGKVLSEKLSFAFTDADQYHSPQNRKKMSSGLPLTDEDRLPWLINLGEIINGWLTYGQNGIMACSALKESYRQILIKNSDRTYILFLQGSYELLAKRLAGRQHEFMNASLLASQFETLEKPKNAIYLDASLPPDDITDIACRKLAELESNKGRNFHYGTDGGA